VGFHTGKVITFDGGFCYSVVNVKFNFNILFSDLYRCNILKYLLVLFLVSCSLLISAQSYNKELYRFGWKFGYTAHTITGGRVKSKVKDYFEGGLWLQLKLSKKWTAQAEILFVEKGTGGSDKNTLKYGGYWVGLYYFEVPLLFQVHPKKWLFEFGPGIGVLIYGHENLHGAPSPDMTAEYPFDKKEISFNAGIGYTINMKWFWGLRFTHSLMPVRTQLPDISEQVYNRILALQVSRRVSFKAPKTTKHSED